MMLALREWRHYLKGAKQQFEIWSDHRNLTYFKQPQTVQPRQARWFLELADFDFTLHHRPGRLMAKADALSRRSDHDQGNEHNKDITLLKPELFRAQIFDFSGQEHTLVKQIKKLDVEPEIVNAVENEEEGWCEEGGLYLYKDRVYVPESVMRERILSQYHDTVLAGHPGQLKTRDLIERNFYWKTIKQDVAKYVSGCETCQRTKVNHGKKAAPLYPNSIPKGPWETISMDLIGPLPESQGYDSILNVVDRFSKEMVAIPCHTTLTAEGCARLLME